MHYMFPTSVYHPLFVIYLFILETPVHIRKYNIDTGGEEAEECTGPRSPYEQTELGGKYEC